MPRPWWQRAMSYVPSHAGPDTVTLRPCGCRIDPVVFGHYCAEGGYYGA